MWCCKWCCWWCFVGGGSVVGVIGFVCVGGSGVGGDSGDVDGVCVLSVGVLWYLTIDVDLVIPWVDGRDDMFGAGDGVGFHSSTGGRGSCNVVTVAP